MNIMKGGGVFLSCCREPTWVKPQITTNDSQQQATNTIQQTSNIKQQATNTKLVLPLTERTNLPEKKIISEIKNCYKCEVNPTETVLQYIGLIQYLLNDWNECKICPFMTYDILNFLKNDFSCFQIPSNVFPNPKQQIVFDKLNDGFSKISLSNNFSEINLFNMIELLHVVGFVSYNNEIYLQRKNKATIFKYIKVFEFVEDKNIMQAAQTKYTQKSTMVDENIKKYYLNVSSKFENFCNRTERLSFYKDIVDYTKNLGTYAEYALNTITHIFRISKTLKYQELNCNFLQYTNSNYLKDVHVNLDSDAFYVYAGKDMIYSRSGISITQFKGNKIILLTSMSTTIDLNIAIEFLTKTCPILVKIKIPFSLMNLIFPIGTISSIKSDLEIILPLSTTLLVNNVSISHLVNVGGYGAPYTVVETELCEFDQNVNQLFKKLLKCSKPLEQIGGLEVKTRDGVSRFDNNIHICTIKELVNEETLLDIVEKFDSTYFDVIDQDECLKSRLITKKILKQQDARFNIDKKCPANTCYIAYIDYTIYDDDYIANEKDDIGYISISDFEKKYKKKPSSYLLMDNHLDGSRFDNVRSLKLTDLSRIDKVSQLYYKTETERMNFVTIKKYKAFIYYEYMKYKDSFDKNTFRQLQRLKSYSEIISVNNGGSNRNEMVPYIDYTIPNMKKNNEDDIGRISITDFNNNKKLPKKNKDIVDIVYDQLYGQPSTSKEKFFKVKKYKYRVYKKYIAYQRKHGIVEIDIATQLLLEQRKQNYKNVLIKLKNDYK